MKEGRFIEIGKPSKAKALSQILFAGPRKVGTWKPAGPGTHPVNQFARKVRMKNIFSYMKYQASSRPELSR